MKHDLRFLKILFWETIENAPLLIGFLWSARIQSENLILALVILVAGTACGAALIHITESKKYSNQPAKKETLVNFVVFTLIAIPFVFYVSTNDAWWSNWITDIILGVVAGFLLSFGESWGWNSNTTVQVHALSMGIAFTLFLYGIRITHQFELPLALLLVGVVFNLFISVIIVWFDYWPIKESNSLATTHLK